jgi:phosphate starvation-inducible PhoH-like protein
MSLQFNKSTPKNNKKGYRFLLSLNEEQKQAKTVILENTLSIIKGKAGSGKTLLACQIALQEVLEKRKKKIVITRPTISKEDLGFLPGGLEDKMAPWVAPIYANMFQLLRKERVEKMVSNGIIEIVPVSYMRGRTFLDSCVIVDECQNLDHEQTLMILQRIGLNSRMIFCGDTDQIDLKKESETGFKFLSSVISVPGLHTIELLNNHRHPILDDVLDVYKNYKYRKGL